VVLLTTTLFSTNADSIRHARRLWRFSIFCDMPHQLREPHMTLPGLARVGGCRGFKRTFSCGTLTLLTARSCLRTNRQRPRAPLRLPQHFFCNQRPWTRTPATVFHTTLPSRSPFIALFLPYLCHRILALLPSATAADRYVIPRVYLYLPGLYEGPTDDLLVYGTAYRTLRRISSLYVCRAPLPHHIYSDACKPADLLLPLSINQYMKIICTIPFPFCTLAQHGSLTAQQNLLEYVAYAYLCRFPHGTTPQPATPSPHPAALPWRTCLFACALSPARPIMHI